MPSSFSGDLSADSPALLNTLKRAGFSAEQIALLEQQYRESASKNDLSESIDSLRTPHTSFNPRPARLALIYLKELHATFPPLQNIALLERLLANPELRELSVIDEPIPWGIVLLDELRHAHLISRQCDTVKSAGQLLSTEACAHLPERLRVLLISAHERS